MKDLVAKASGTELFPNLLNRIHFRGIGRDEHDFNIGKNFQCAGFMPCSPVTNKYDVIIRVRCRQMLQKDIHAGGVAVRHDQKTRVPS